MIWWCCVRVSGKNHFRDEIWDRNLEMKNGKNFSPWESFVWDSRRYGQTEKRVLWGRPRFLFEFPCDDVYREVFIPRLVSDTTSHQSVTQDSIRRCTYCPCIHALIDPMSNAKLSTSRPRLGRWNYRSPQGNDFCVLVPRGWFAKLKKCETISWTKVLIFW